MTADFDSSIRRDRAQALLTQSTVLCDPDEVDAAVDRLARAIAKRFSDAYPIFCCVMTGGLILSGRLLVRLNFPLDIDYVDVSRYGDGDVGEKLTWRVKPKLDLTGRVVVLVDDILDEGHTLAQVRSALLDAGAESVFIAVLAEKTLDIDKPVSADFVGVRLPNRFVFGCGMDAYGYWRNLPSIHAVGQEEGR